MHAQDNRPAQCAAIAEDIEAGFCFWLARGQAFRSPQQSKSDVTNLLAYYSVFEHDLSYISAANVFSFIPPARTVHDSSLFFYINLTVRKAMVYEMHNGSAFAKLVYSWISPLS